jgi:dolichol kinase
MTQPWEGNRLTSPGATPLAHKGPETPHTNATIDFKSEIIRKGIHICSLSIPIVYSFISKEQALTILIPLTLAFLTVDIARHYHTPTSEWFYRWFGRLLRHHESNVDRKRLNGATNVLLSACLCVFLFPKIITVNAFSVLIISDTTSALVGRRFGRHPFLNKSREGAIAFLLSALAVVSVAPKVDGLLAEYLIAAFAAVVAAVAEALSVEVDDNISVPLSFGTVMWGLYLWLLPALDLSSAM